MGRSAKTHVIDADRLWKLVTRAPTIKVWFNNAPEALPFNICRLLWCALNKVTDGKRYLYQYQLHRVLL